MMKKEIEDKIKSCKALQGVTVEELVSSDRFEKNLGAYIKAQQEERKAARASYAALRAKGLAFGYKLPSHVCDKVLCLSDAEFAHEYLLVLSGKSGRSASERKYIQQLGQQAYNVTVAQIVVEEFPELEGEFFKKSNAN